MKNKETLEEAAERFVENTRLKNPKSIFCEGAKWNQERSYSEKEVYNLILKYQNEYIYANNEKGLKYFFEQLKKK